MFDDPTSLEDDLLLGDEAVEPSVEVYCPYCGEPSQILVDAGSGMDQTYVEDCEVCCRPRTVRVRFHDGIPSVEVGTEDDAVF